MDLIREFESRYPYPLDDYQRRAVEAVHEGRSVLVCAPTGAGKTLAAEFAVWLALRRGERCFYTSPIKALTNQKFGDFGEAFGTGNVGILTGDTSYQGHAPVVTMTTEVLRNMLYDTALPTPPDPDASELIDEVLFGSSHALEGLRYVVLDEVHYLQDRYRGAVWEEILIHLPVDVQVVSLSATVSNAEEFGEWLQTLRGRTEVIIEEHRPVEIRHWYFASDEMLPMFVHKPDGTPLPNPRAGELERRRRRGPSRPGRGGRRTHEKRTRIPLRTEVIDRLAAERMLPAIYFIFSRKGCDAAVEQCLRDGVRLTTSDERKIITELAESRIADLPLDELEVLRYDTWLEALRRGIAAHHAGMIPLFKETVEELFTRGLVKAVFATETLALGINMPARTVVIESLMKFTGEKHEQMTPGEFTQLSGRAGRRGIDELGHCVVLLQRFVHFDAITRLATTRTYPLQSSFRPSYNMAVNLIRNYDRGEAEHLVNSSFAQFQADRDVVRLERSRERSESYLASYREKVHCDLGDIDGYLGLRNRLRALEGAVGHRTMGKRVEDALRALRPGDVIEIEAGKRRGRYAVLEVTQKRSEKRPRILAQSLDRSMVRLGAIDFQRPPRPIARLDLPRDFRAREPADRREVSRKLKDLKVRQRPRERAIHLDAEGSDEEKELIEAIESHPCHHCPDIKRHVHYAERAQRLDKEVRSIDRRIGKRTGTLAAMFEKVLEVLEDLDYVSDWALTAKGERLARVYNESDLLVVEALEDGIAEDLSSPELAALLSTMVYETRGPEPPEAPDMPTKETIEAWTLLKQLWRRIRKDEDRRRLDLTREPDPGFAGRALLWTEGAPLEDVLGEDDAPGDFVRSMKQLIDLLRQVEEIAPTEDMADRVHEALDAVQRGVVAYSSIET